MPTLNANGITVHYRETGAGKPLLLLHGGGSSGAQWRRVVEILSPRYRMITMDHYGHGGTDLWPGAPEERTHEAEVELVRAVIDRACHREPVHLVGHSYGGGVALRLIAHDPSPVRSLVLMEPQAMPLLREAGEETYFGEFQELIDGFISKVEEGRIEEAWRNFIDSNNHSGAWDAMPESARKKMFDLTASIVSGWHANMSHATTLAECRDISLPTSLFYGGETSPRYRRLTEIIAGEIPASRLEAIPGAGHMSMLTHPEEVAEAIGEHLNRHGLPA